MNKFSHYYNFKQRIFLDIEQLKNYKMIIFLIFLIVLYLFDSVFFYIFFYTYIYIYFFDYILLIADILFLDILFKRLKLFQKAYIYLRNYFYLIFYKYLVIDLLKFSKQKLKNCIKTLTYYWNKGRAAYNFGVLSLFIYEFIKKWYYKSYFGFKRLRRRDKTSSFWKYIYIFYYREKNIKVFFLIIYSYFYDIFCSIYNLHVFIIFNYMYNFILILASRLKYLFLLFLGEVKYYYFTFYYKIYYINFINYYRIQYIICYKTKYIRYFVIYYYYYIFCDIIKNIIIKFLISKIIIIILFVIDKYIYNYENDYSIVITKIKYLKDYFFFKYLKIFNGFFFFKRDKVLLIMLYKLLHVRTIFNIILSFFKIIEKVMRKYNYIYEHLLLFFNYVEGLSCLGIAKLKKLRKKIKIFFNI